MSVPNCSSPLLPIRFTGLTCDEQIQTAKVPRTNQRPKIGNTKTKTKPWARVCINKESDALFGLFHAVVNMAGDPCKLYVGGLSFDTTEENLRQAFENCGVVTVTEVKIIYDRETDRSKGFGFVTFASEEMAEKAKNQMDNTELDKRTIRVSPARAQQSRGFSGGGGYGGYGGRGGGGGSYGRGGGGGGGYGSYGY